MTLHRTETISAAIRTAAILGSRDREGFTPEEMAEYLDWLRRLRRRAADLQKVVDDPFNEGLSIPGLTAIIVAADLCLKTYTGKDGLLAEAEKLLLEQFPSGVPWSRSTVTTQ